MKHDIRHHLRTLANWLAILRSEGWSTLSRLRHLNGQETTLQLRSLAHPFHLRLIPSHVDGLVQNVFRGEYDALLAGRNPKVIIDAGSFIGDLACHWATRFPEARIIALEPNAENFAFARRNTDPYSGRIALLNAGLWSHRCALSVSGSEMGSQVSESAAAQPGCIDAVDIPWLMENHQFERLDILKLDIEGAEKVVLGPGCADWTGRVGELVVEMHGADIEAEIVARLAGFGFTACRRRSLVFFQRNPA